MEPNEKLIRAITLLENLTVKVTTLDGKVDLVIDRNNKADRQLAVLDEKIQNYDNTFKTINHKHDKYDRFVTMVLIFAVVELLGVIAAIMNN